MTERIRGQVTARMLNVYCNPSPAEVARTKSPAAGATERGPLPLEPPLGRDPRDRHAVSILQEWLAEAARQLAAVNASTEEVRLFAIRQYLEAK